tara:strand:+ start:2925 stop:3350 length:426 start_codon:yes stop_codon:yes gene_type:complete
MNTIPKPSDELDGVPDEDEIDLIETGPKAHLGLLIKRTALIDAIAKLNDRRDFIETVQEGDGIDNQISELESRIEQINDRLSTIWDNPFIEPPTVEQLKEIRNRTIALTDMNADATAATAMFGLAVEIFEMAIGGDHLASV